MKKNCLKVAQISDMHIGQSEFVQGINVRENFRRALYSDSVKDCDFIMLSGDLAEDGSEEAYKFVLQEMEKFGRPWNFIIGNHDDTKNCMKVLRGEPDFNFTFDYVQDVFGRRFVCLDSSSGKVTGEQIEWLRRQARVRGPFYLFTHYPPCICGHRFMDTNFSMKNMEAFQNVLAEFDNLKYIFCGHYHVPYKIRLKSGQIVYVAPATEMQISERKKEFHIITQKPAWQIIEFDGDDLNVRIISDE